jgi:hypothetical protein
MSRELEDGETMLALDPLFSAIFIIMIHEMIPDILEFFPAVRAALQVKHGFLLKKPNVNSGNILSFNVNTVNIRGIIFEWPIPIIMEI